MDDCLDKDSPEGIRRVFVFRPVEIEMEELRAGDIFIMDPKTPEDTECPEDLMFAITDAVPMENDKYKCAIQATRLIKDPDYGK